MKLKKLRISKGLTQKDIGKLVNHSGQTILNWENGINDPSIRDLIKLADFFGVSVDYLIDYDVKNCSKQDMYYELRKIKIDDLVNFINNALKEMEKKTNNK